MSTSQFANNLRCLYCGKTHGTQEWPIYGDMVPIYYQKTPGKYALTVTCPHCNNEWYVVWDDDPGPIQPLLS